MSSNLNAKNRKIIGFIAVLIVLSGILLYAKNDLRNSSPEISCTADAKLCPDGSSVGRTGPDCEFAACPASEEKAFYGFSNSQIGKAIADYLVTQSAFAWHTRQDSHNFCIVENLDPQKELFPLYVWARCGEFAKENGSLREVSGVSLPIKIDYPNELSYYNPALFAYEAPGDGAAYEKDIRKIFPAEIQEAILSYDTSALSAKLAAQAPAWFEAEVENDENWLAIKTAVAECRAESIMQTHSLRVSANLKDGTRLEATEPEIDDIIDLAIAAQEKCGSIPMATE
jgi:hypothetical protein